MRPSRSTGTKQNSPFSGLSLLCAYVSAGTSMHSCPSHLRHHPGSACSTVLPPPRQVHLRTAVPGRCLRASLLLSTPLPTPHSNPGPQRLFSDACAAGSLTAISIRVPFCCPFPALFHEDGCAPSLQQQPFCLLEKGHNASEGKRTEGTLEGERRYWERP